MKIQPYISKLESSRIFKNFRKEYNNAFLVAGFFVLDFETGTNMHQIDYYLPKQKKVAAFTLDGEVDLKVMQTMHDKIPEKLEIKTNVDLDALKGILQDEMKNRNITENIKKIIAVLQTTEGKKIWILNCILSGMEILKAHIDDESRTVLSMEKASILDYIKKMPGTGGGMSPKQLTKVELEKQIKQLDKIKAELEKEKAKLPKGKAGKSDKKGKKKQEPESEDEEEPEEVMNVAVANDVDDD